MTEKNSYEISLDNVVLRRAKETDNFQEIASLIYETDPNIYPYWFDNNKEEAINYFVKRMKINGFLFNYQNFYIAYDEEQQRIVGAICAVDPTTDLKYDYNESESINERYALIIERYIKGIIKEVEEGQYMCLVCVCVSPNLRSKKIGTLLLGTFVKQMQLVGYNDISLDCLMYNLRAKNLYHSVGFKEVAHGKGFDGTELVFFKNKTTPFTEKDFKMPSEEELQTSILIKKER